jgi:hypothetical protein
LVFTRIRPQEFVVVDGISTPPRWSSAPNAYADEISSRADARLFFASRLKGEPDALIGRVCAAVAALGHLLRDVGTNPILAHCEQDGGGSPSPLSSAAAKLDMNLPVGKARFPERPGFSVEVA